MNGIISEYEEKITKFMDFLKVNDKMMIINKISEMKNKKISFDELKNTYS